jgi:serine/threonine-protein kinase
MLTEYQKRAAALAASRYRLDRAQVQEVLEAAIARPGRDEPVNVFHFLVQQNLLSAAQAQELLAALGDNPDEPSPSDSQARTVLPSVGVEAAGQNTGATPEAILLAAGLEPRRIGDYQILRRIGEGGMGAVYLGYHEKSAQQVAIKVLPDQLAANQSYVDRFYREARSVAHLDHPNIVRGIAVGRDVSSDSHFLVMEYVDGPSAHALISRFGKLPVGDAVHIILDIARALEHAHSRSIIHRDIKPDNILLTRSGLAKLADLGLARRTDEESHLTAAKQGFGTPHYMPYEQALNARDADARSDIYALGATLYHLVTGTIPFPGKSPLDVAEKKDRGVFVPASQLNAEVPERLDRILNKMLARAPDDRYQTASELIVELERSHLAAAVPSFINLDLALEDPYVRARLTSPAEPTQPALGRTDGRGPKGERKTPEQAAPGATAQRGTAAPDGLEVWYLRYRNREGRWCKTRATTKQILERLRDGRLGPSVGASQEAHGEFRPIGTYAPFAQAAATRIKTAAAAKPNGQENNADGESQRQTAPASAPRRGLRLKRGLVWIVSVATLAVVLAAVAYLLWK